MVSVVGGPCRVAGVLEPSHFATHQAFVDGEFGRDLFGRHPVMVADEEEKVSITSIDFWESQLMIHSRLKATVQGANEFSDFYDVQGNGLLLGFSIAYHMVDK